jgi:hypothetical protein
MLDAKQEQAARMLASGASHAVVARQLELEPGTVEVWRRRATFSRRVAELLEEVEEVTSTRMRALGAWALEQLVRMAADDSVAAATRERILSRLLEQSGLTVAAKAKDVADMGREDVVELVAALPVDVVDEARRRMSVA